MNGTVRDMLRLYECFRLILWEKALRFREYRKVYDDYVRLTESRPCFVGPAFPDWFHEEEVLPC